jgi:hypothetical protein
MRIVTSTYKKPANLLIGALQKYCEEILSQPQRFGVYNLKDLEDKLWQFAVAQQPSYRKCDLAKLDVISHSNLVHEYYHLLYNGERSMIFITARPDAYEKAFRDYDNLQQPAVRN